MAINTVASNNIGNAFEKVCPLERIPKIKKVEKGKDNANIFTANVPSKVCLSSAILISLEFIAEICAKGQKLHALKPKLNSKRISF